MRWWKESRKEAVLSQDQVYGGVDRPARSRFVAGMYYAAGVLSLLGLAVSAWFSTLLARADREFRAGTPEGVARAVELTQRNTDYLALRALQIEYEGGDSQPMLESAAKINPASTRPRIQLGLNAEIRGDFETAQRWLLDAARVDRQFEPAWTLANFYYRQQMPERFWVWMHTALEVSYGDRRPAFDLCWNVTSNGQEILTRAIPPRREVEAAYLSYLLQKNRLADVTPVALRLALSRNAVDLPLLYAACDALLDAGDGAAALDMWTALSQPVNPDFDAPRIGHGFDWRVVSSTGVQHVSNRIVFNGQQPESCELLRQFQHLQAGQPYVLRWEARTSGFPAQTGLEWRVTDQTGAVPSHEDWQPNEFRFTARTDWPVLSLNYQRPTGEPRAEGYVELRHVSLSHR
jgi:hypothetical protein